jgi:hypothetical protein
MAVKSYKNFLQGIGVIPKGSSDNAALGDVEVLNTTNTLNFHNGSSSSQILTVAHAAQGTLRVLNKDLDDTTTAIVDSIDTTKKILFDAAGSTGTTTTLLSSQTVSRVLTLPNITDTLVTRTNTEALSNKTLTAPIINNATADTITGITGGNLSLQPATGQNVVVNGITFALSAGVNTLSGSTVNVTASAASTYTAATSLTLTSPKVKVNGALMVNEVVDTTAGSNVAIAAPTSPYISLTSGSLVSVDTIVSNADNEFLVLTNKTGNSIVINNDTGATTSNRILTGTGAFITLQNNQSIFLSYSNNASRWMVVGGTGSGNSTFDDIAGENITAGQALYISNGTGTDSGRTAGRAYKLDATNSDRVEFIGFAATSATTGNTVRVQTIGEITGLSGLTVGKQVFASISSAGALQTTPPSVLNQWIIPVGIATSATSMAINGAGSSTAVQIAGAIVDNLYSAVDTYTSSTAITNNQGVVLANATSGSVTITVPAATGNKGKIFNIKKIDSSANTVIIAAASGNIDGSSTRTLALQYDSYMLASDGSKLLI